MSNLAPNPLLDFAAPLPRFDLFEVSHVGPALEELLPDLEARLSELEQLSTPVELDRAWEELLEPLEVICDRLNRVWGIVAHLLGVKNSEELREVYRQYLPKVVMFSQRISQSRPIYNHLVAVTEQEGSSSWPEPTRRLLRNWVLAARLAGVGLDGEQAERFNQIKQELAQLAQDYSNHVMDDQAERGIKVVDPQAMKGVPEVVVRRAKERAIELGLAPKDSDSDSSFAGPWFVSVDPTMSRPFFQHCRDSKLREELYRQSIAVASEGERDNSGLVEEILKRKNEQAELLGYSSVAEMLIEPRMAKGPEEVKGFLENLIKQVKPAAAEQFQAVAELAKAQGEGEVKLWDLAFWSERYREAELGFSLEELRPYFSFERVLAGALELFSSLYGISFQKRSESVPVWHLDVSFFDVVDAGGEVIAGVYIDPYVRPETKRSGAWMGTCRSRYELQSGEGSLPVAYVVCNQTPPGGGTPGLMTLQEVTTLFHEFGHALQHLLSSESRIGTTGLEMSEWDSVEIASQFQESWVYERKTLDLIARHYETDEPLPSKYLEGLLASRSLLQGLHIIRQLHLASTDLELFFSRTTTASKAFECYLEIGRRIRAIPPMPEDRMLCSFGHIFAGGYSAGYYSYLWSDVYSADLYSAFEDELNKSAEQDWKAVLSEIGGRFRDQFLSRAGSIDVAKAFETFRGRPLEQRPFLVVNGLG